MYVLLLITNKNIFFKKVCLIIELGSFLFRINKIFAFTTEIAFVLLFLPVLSKCDKINTICLNKNVTNSIIVCKMRKKIMYRGEYI